MVSSTLVQAVLEGVLGGGRKRSSRARRYLTGGKSSLWAGPGVLMTAAGMAWGAIESLRQSDDGSPPPPTPGSSAGPGGRVPPLPGESAPGEVDAGLRLIRLAISAANADGAVKDQEHAAILQRARADGHADLAEQELRQVRPLAEIVAGVSDPADKATLYVLAFTIIRADEQVSPAERIYLAQLAHLLGLDRAAAERLEQSTGERIDALGDQGQPGG
jgi:uncharacterized membrane protein YebE (DUF533 family)